MAEISNTNKKMVEMIRRKIARSTKSTTFEKHITLIQGSISKLKVFNEHLNKLSPEVNTLEKLKKAVVLDKRTVKQQIKERKELKLNEQGLRTLKVPMQKAVQKTLQILKPFKDVKVNQLPIIYRKCNQAIQIKVKHQKMSRDDIQKYANEVSKSLKRNGIKGIMEISLLYTSRWNTGSQNSIGNNVHLYTVLDSDAEQDEEDVFDRFNIYIIPDNLPDVGGADQYNDCLYNCLTATYVKLPWDTPEKFKKFLNVPRYAGVSVTKIEEIEKKLNNTSINVTGDFTYTSKIKATKIINLKLINQHYSNVFDKKNNKVKNVSYERRKPIIYDTKTYMCYDGEKEYKLSLEYKKEIYAWKTPYILVNRDVNKMSKRSYKMFRLKGDDIDTEYEEFIEMKGIDKRLTLKEEYELFIHDADILNTETNGLINLYKTGNNADTALNLFDRFTKIIKNPSTIRQIEASFISKCKGSIIFGQTYSGPAYKYDVKSMYPSIQTSSLKFPIAEAEILYLTYEEFIDMPHFKYGIYRVKVYKSDIHTNKVFRFNSENYYTHTDLERAKEIGLKYELIIDNQPNFIHYSRDKLMSGSEIFGEFIKIMFDYKQRNLPRSKTIINILWGKLCECNKKKETIKQNGFIFQVPDDAYIINIRPSHHNEDENIIEYAYNDNAYKSGWGRIGVFLISKGKSIISKIIEPYKEICVRSHTDSMVVTKYPEGIITGNKLGELAYEGYANNCVIKNSMNMKGKFKL